MFKITMEWLEYKNGEYVTCTSTENFAAESAYAAKELAFRKYQYHHEPKVTRCILIA